MVGEFGIVREIASWHKLCLLTTLVSNVKQKKNKQTVLSMFIKSCHIVIWLCYVFVSSQDDFFQGHKSFGYVTFSVKFIVNSKINWSIFITHLTYLAFQTCHYKRIELLILEQRMKIKRKYQ